MKKYGIFVGIYISIICLLGLSACNVESDSGHQHEFTESGITTPATCTMEGEKWYACACGFKKFETLPALGHKWETEQVIKEPTCTEDGKKVTGKCERCGLGGQTLSIPATGHTWEEKEQTPATCTQDGVSLKRCTTCGKEERTQIPKLDHVWEEKEQTPATCTKSGVSLKRCTRCGEEETTQIPALGHNYGETQTDADGKLFRECTRCHFKDMLGEALDYTINVVPKDECKFHLSDKSQIILYEYKSGVWTPSRTFGAEESQTIRLPRGKYHVRVDPLSEEYLQTEGEMTEENPTATIEIRDNPAYDHEIDRVVKVGDTMFNFLVKDTTKEASEWKRFNDLKEGKELIYIDFFYVACYPCGLLLDSQVSWWKTVEEEVKEKVLVIMVDITYDTVDNINHHRQNHNIPEEFITMADGARVQANAPHSDYVPFGFFVDGTGKILETTGNGHSLEEEVNLRVKKNGKAAAISADFEGAGDLLAPAKASVPAAAEETFASEPFAWLPYETILHERRFLRNSILSKPRTGGEERK